MDAPRPAAARREPGAPSCRLRARQDRCEGREKGLENACAYVVWLNYSYATYVYACGFARACNIKTFALAVG